MSRGKPFLKLQISNYRVQTDPGKPGKMVNFERTQGNPGNFFYFPLKLREFFSEENSHIKYLVDIDFLVDFL